MEYLFPAVFILYGLTFLFILSLFALTSWMYEIHPRIRTVCTRRCFEKSNICNLAFVVHQHWGERRHTFTWRRYEISPDANWTLIIENQRGDPIGILGIEVDHLKTLHVLQMQGLKGANFRGESAVDFFLTRIEHVAEFLNCKKIRISAPSQLNYFFKEGLDCKKLDVHQNRLRELYLRGPLRNGYYHLPAAAWVVKKIK